MTKDELAAIEELRDKLVTTDYPEQQIDTARELACQHIPALVAEVRRLQMELVAMNEEYYRATCDDK